MGKPVVTRAAGWEPFPVHGAMRFGRTLPHLVLDDEMKIPGSE